MNRQADIIKVAAVVTAMPRWVGALLAAEGLEIPSTWWWWLWLSVAANFGMAVVEGFAFAYVFNAWRRTSGKPARNLLKLALFSAGAFIFVIAPFVASRVRNVPLSDILNHNAALFAWSVAVAASTIAIVASVGYAQKAPKTQTATKKAEPEPQPAEDAYRPTANIANWRTIYTTNGDLRDVDAATVARELSLRGFAVPSKRTLQSWAREAREGES